MNEGLNTGVITAITTSETNMNYIRVSGNLRQERNIQLGIPYYHLHCNPLVPEFRNNVLDILRSDKAILPLTITITKDILDDEEILTALREKAVQGVCVRIADEGYTLTREDYNKLSFASLIFVDYSEESLQNEEKIVNQFNVFKLEAQLAQPVLERRNSFDELVSRLTFHINHKLSEEEFTFLAQRLNSEDNATIELDYFDPSYYEEFLEGLERHNVKPNINIQLIGYLLEDQLDTYEKLMKYPYEIDVVYSTCHDMVKLYETEPYTSDRLYYSQIEGGGKTSLQNYINVLNVLTDFETSAKSGNLSPLEIAIYAKMRIDEEYIYDPDYQNDDVDQWDNINLSQIINHEVDGKKRAICLGFSTMYSALLRRSGIPMFRYSTTGHNRNIGRIHDEKYDVDTICVCDITEDLYSSNENLPRYGHFMIAPRNFLQQFVPEHMTIADTFALPIDDYYNNLPFTGLLYEQFYHPHDFDPMGYTARMLGLMGVVPENENIIDVYNIIYRLCEENHLESVPPETILNAIENVLQFRGENQSSINSYQQTVEESLLEQTLTYGYSPLIRDRDDYEDYPLVTYPVEVLTPENVHEYRESLPEERPQYFKDIEPILFPEEQEEATAEEEITSQEMINDMLNEYDEQMIKNEKITIFKNNQTNEIFVYQYALERFNIIPIGPSVRVNGANCYPISLEDEDRIINNQNNENSSYIVVENEIMELQIENNNEFNANENYIMQLIQYTEENNISIFHYYVELGRNYRNDDNYQPPVFEQNNPFIKENDINLLRQSKEEHIELYFANCMSNVIEYNNPQNIIHNQQDLLIDDAEELKEEVRHR